MSFVHHSEPKTHILYVGFIDLKPVNVYGSENEAREFLKGEGFRSYSPYKSAIIKEDYFTAEEIATGKLQTDCKCGRPNVSFRCGKCHEALCQDCCKSHAHSGKGV